MKKYNYLFVLPVILALGCATLFKASITLTKVVDTALKEAAALKVQGFMPAETELRLISAHETYRKAAGTAVVALEAYKLSGDKAEYVRALETARGAASSIIELLVPLIGAARSDDLKGDLKKASKL